MPRSDRHASPSGRLFLPTTALALILALALPTPRADAGITGFNIFGNLESTQTSDAAPTGTPQAFFNSQITSNNATDLTSATGSSGTSSTYSLALQPDHSALYQTGFITPTQLNTYLTPLGSKANFNITGGTLAGQSASLFIPSPLFAPFAPYLTLGSYDQIQNFNIAAIDTIHFSNFLTVAGATESDIFITITRTSDDSVAYSTELSHTATSFNLPANALAAGTSYNLEIDFSSRLVATNAGFGGATFTAGYDQRTEIAFATTASTAVPEPGSLGLTAIGAASGLLLARGRRPRPRA